MDASPIKPTQEKCPAVETNTLDQLLQAAETLMLQNLRQGKSPQSAITITCISLGIDPSPLSDNAVLDHLWTQVYRHLPPEE
jgi:hypothetical protein